MRERNDKRVLINKNGVFEMSTSLLYIENKCLKKELTYCPILMC